MRFPPRPVRLVLLDGYGVTLDPGNSAQLHSAFAGMGFPGLLDAPLYRHLIGAHREGRSHVLVAGTPGAYREMVRHERLVALREALVRQGLSSADATHSAAGAYAVVRDYLDDFYASVRPLPGVPEFLEQLRSRGFALTMCSNSERVREAARSAGIAPYFSRILGAEELGALKPMGEPHRRACDLNGRSPAESAAVDDRWASGGKAACRAGLRVVLLEPDPAELPSRLPRNVHVADGHAAALSALRHWAGPVRTAVGATVPTARQAVEPRGGVAARRPAPLWEQRMRRELTRTPPRPR